jgi:hypothetical protein
LGQRKSELAAASAQTRTHPQRLRTLEYCARPASCTITAATRRSAARDSGCRGGATAGCPPSAAAAAASPSPSMCSTESARRISSSTTPNCLPGSSALIGKRNRIVNKQTLNSLNAYCKAFVIWVLPSRTCTHSCGIHISLAAPGGAGLAAPGLHLRQRRLHRPRARRARRRRRHRSRHRRRRRRRRAAPRSGGAPHACAGRPGSGSARWSTCPRTQARVSSGSGRARCTKKSPHGARRLCSTPDRRPVASDMRNMDQVETRQGSAAARQRRGPAAGARAGVGGVEVLLQQVRQPLQVVEDRVVCARAHTALCLRAAARPSSP